MPGVCAVVRVSSNTGCPVYYACLRKRSCLAESESSNTGCAVYYACLSEHSCQAESESWNTGCAVYYSCLSERSCLTKSESSTVFYLCVEDAVSQFPMSCFEPGGVTLCKTRSKHTND